MLKRKAEGLCEVEQYLSRRFRNWNKEVLRMKLHQLLIVGVLTTTVLCGTASAKYQQRLFGNGRFLKRMRDDLTGKSTPKQPTAAKTKANTEAKGKTPTLAKSKSSATAPRSNAKTPTPAVRGKTPTLARSSNSKTTPRSVAGPSASPKEVSRSAKKPTIGFGMLLETKGDDIAVTQIDPRGNANEAGIKKGDLIRGAGGVDLTSLEEFNEITNILGQGDQLEFNVERRGKKKDILIQFGTAPEEGKIVETPAPKKKNDYSFVPEGDEKPHAGLRSIVSQPSAEFSRPTTRPPNAAGYQSRAIQTSSQRLIEEQRQQIQQMQREIQRLKQGSLVAPTQSTPSGGRTILEGPSLSGPGN